MAWDHHNLVSKVLPIRAGTDDTISPPTVGGRILNMELTEAGNLRSIVGPVEYRPATYTNNGGTAVPAFTYTAPLYGVHHGLLEGGKRDVLLIHDAQGIWVLDGWTSQGWRYLIAPLPISSAEVTLAMDEMDGRTRFQTQFVNTPNGIVIIPQGDRAYFYDGTLIAPLGFTEVPGPPTAIGPKRTMVEGDNDDDIADDIAGFYKTGRNMNKVMGNNRCGSIRNDVLQSAYDGAAASSLKTNRLGGTRMSGSWSAKLQFMDAWGNLSALSPQSTEIVVPKEDNLTKDRRKDDDELAEALRVQFAWGDLDEGPEHCVARNLYRTHDKLNSGIPGYHWLAPISAGSTLIAATMASREQKIYPDNTPDNRLIQRATEYVPVPIFRLAEVAFGRLWVANTRDNPGMLRPSEPFFWGTFPKDMEVFPDATGAEITGLLAVAGGLLVFTETSTFLVTENDGGDSYKTAVLSNTVGCVAPDSTAVLLDGRGMWLGRDGFYTWSGTGQPFQISQPIKDRLIHRINKGWRRKAVAAVDPRMGEYRCWVPVDGSQENNLCMVFHPEHGWRERDDVYAEAVCVTQDHRQYMLAFGRAQHIDNHTSLWVLDHDGKGTKEWNGYRESFVETTWLRNTRSQRRGSPVRAQLWLRESTSGNLTIEVMRDWREYPRIQETGENPPNYAEDDNTPFWGTTLTDSTVEDELRDLVREDALPTHMVRRRPYWTKVDIMLPSSETFRVRITGTGDWEFIAMSFDEQDRHAGGMKLPLGD